MKRQGNDDKNS